MAIEVTLNIVTSSGEIVNDVNIPYRYYHPREHEEVLPASYDFEEYVENLKKAHAEREFRGLYHAVENVQIGTRRRDIVKCCGSPVPGRRPSVS